MGIPRFPHFPVVHFICIEPVGTTSILHKPEAGFNHVHFVQALFSPRIFPVSLICMPSPWGSKTLSPVRLQGCIGIDKAFHDLSVNASNTVLTGRIHLKPFYQFHLPSYKGDATFFKDRKLPFYRSSHRKSPNTLTRVIGFPCTRLISRDYSLKSTFPLLRKDPMRQNCSLRSIIFLHELVSLRRLALPLFTGAIYGVLFVPVFLQNKQKVPVPEAGCHCGPTPSADGISSTGQLFVKEKGKACL